MASEVWIGIRRIVSWVGRTPREDTAVGVRDALRRWRRQTLVFLLEPPTVADQHRLGPVSPAELLGWSWPINRARIHGATHKP